MNRTRKIAMFVRESDRLFFQQAAHSWTVHPAAITTPQPLCHSDVATAEEGWGGGGERGGGGECGSKEGEGDEPGVNE